MAKIHDFVGFLRRTTSYRRKYGALRGMRLALQVRRAAYAAPPGELVEVNVPGLPSPVVLRACTSDAAVFQMIFVEDELRVNLDGPKFIVDAGAYIGVSSIYLSQRFPGARVVALELDSGNFALLKKNTVAYPNIVPMHAGLWSHQTNVCVSNPQAERWSFRASEIPEGEKGAIWAVGIADLLCEFPVDTIDLLKIDIEGAEKEVFSRGAEAWIDRVRVLAVELHDRFQSGCTEALEQAIKGRDYARNVQGEYTILTRQSSCICSLLPTRDCLET